MQIEGRETTTIHNTSFERLFQHSGSAEVFDIVSDLGHCDLDYSATEIQEITGLSRATVMSNLQNFKDEKIIIENDNGKFKGNKESDRCRCLCLYIRATLEENLDGLAESNKTRKS